LGSTNIAGIEAEALMREEADRLDDGQKAELEMTIAFAEIKKGHRETALHNPFSGGIGRRRPRMGLAEHRHNPAGRQCRKTPCRKMFGGCLSGGRAKG
jgi:hypothetical protein